VNLRPCRAALTALALVLSPAAFAQAARVNASKEAAPLGPWQVEVRGGTGIGSFQDIQVPVNEAANQRGDGTVIEDENQTHTGFPLLAGIGLDWQAENGVRWELVGLDGLQMRASTGPSATQSSSYSRVELASRLAYAFPLNATLKMEVGGGAGLRRSAWTNVSSGHYLNAALLEGRLGVQGATAGVELYGGAAPAAHFGYSNATLLGGSDFKKSTASLAEAGARLALPLRPNVWLETALEREEAKVTVADVSEYNNYGLSVYNPDQPSRAYDLVTTVAKIGFRKAF
jgi:hypothetical protein